MSEYQYYEFQTIDRSLTKEEIGALRALSTRARITSTSFVNSYNYGDFRGDPHALMEQYFDAFLYFANWGTRRLMFRLPRRLVDVEQIAAYCAGEHASMEERGEAVVLEFYYFSEDGEGGDYDEEEEGTLGSLIPLRADLLAGDTRALYLGWLLAAQLYDLEDETEEPPVPAGLGKLSGSLANFVEFLRIDQDLIAVAAERSPALRDSEPSRDEWLAWIRGLPEAEKETLLLRAAGGHDPHLHRELRQRLRRDTAAASGAESPAVPAPAPRTASELLAAAERHAEERKRREAERREAERARREREQAAARAKYLDGLREREPEIWQRVEALIDTKKPKEYDQAVLFLTDLRDLAERSQRVEEFHQRIQLLRQRHASKPSLMQRLDRAGVGMAPGAGMRDTIQSLR